MTAGHATGESAWPLVAVPIHTERLTLLPLRVAHSDEMARVLADPALHTFIGGAPASAAELRTRYSRMLAGPGDPAVSWCNWVIEIREPTTGGQRADQAEPEEVARPEEVGEPEGAAEPEGDAGLSAGGQLAGIVQATVSAPLTGLGADPGTGPERGGGRNTEVEREPRRGEDARPGPLPVSGPGRAAELAWVVGAAWQGRGIATEAARGLAEWLDRRGVGTLVAHVHPEHLASAAVASAVGLVRTGAMHDGEERWERHASAGVEPRDEG